MSRIDKKLKGVYSKLDSLSNNFFFIKNVLIRGMVIFVLIDFTEASYEENSKRIQHKKILTQIFLLDCRFIGKGRYEKVIYHFRRENFTRGVLVGKSVKDGYYSRTNLFQVWS